MSTSLTPGQLDDTISIENFPSTVTVDNFPATTTVDNFPTEYPGTISGTVSVDNFPGTVTESNPEPITRIVYGIPTPELHFALNGTTVSSGTLDASSTYLIQSPEYEVHVKLHVQGATPGALYFRVQPNTDFPFLSSAASPAITVSGTTGSTGAVVLVKLSS